MKKTVVELFAGVGGFRVGLNNINSFDKSGHAIENNDWNFVWANQWEPSTKAQPAFDCYCTRFGKENHANINIQEINKEYIPNHNLLLGGFPCQDYSVARSLSGEKGLHGKKGVLFWDIAEILDKKKPAFVLLENVDRLIKSPSKQRGRDFGIMLRTFSDLGYNVEWRVINAAEYGARQKRRRVFIFAWKKNTNYNKQFNQLNIQEVLTVSGLFAKSFKVEKEMEKINEVVINDSKYLDTAEMTEQFSFNFENTGCMIDNIILTAKTTPKFIPGINLSETLQRNVQEKYYLTDKQIEKFEYLKGAKKIERTREDGGSYTYSEGACSFPENLDSPGRTMLTSEGTTNRSTHVVEDLDTKKIRFITPVEAERLQHFPDNWTNTGLTDRQRYFMMGNALVTYIIKKIEPNLNEIFKNEKDLND